MRMEKSPRTKDCRQARDKRREVLTRSGGAFARPSPVVSVDWVSLLGTLGGYPPVSMGWHGSRRTEKNLGGK